MTKQIDNIEIYQKLVDSIENTITSARLRAIQTVNNELLMANWKIGKYIVEYVQNGNEKAEYGSSLLTNLSQDLKSRFGKGFSFISRQYRITLDNDHYYVDLVFYHRILKCFVLIDLKTNLLWNQTM